MKKNNALFIALTGVSVVLISAIMIDNTTPARTPVRTAVSEDLRQKFSQMGLSLHEGKYWKAIHE